MASAGVTFNVLATATGAAIRSVQVALRAGASVPAAELMELVRERKGAVH